MRSENAGPGSGGAKRADRDQRDGGRAPMAPSAGFDEIRYKIDFCMILLVM